MNLKQILSNKKFYSLPFLLFFMVELIKSSLISTLKDLSKNPIFILKYFFVYFLISLILVCIFYISQKILNNK